jgi:serine-type D-Ala-D-Ala carboxypeptidase (penicillin-binding protein 5/6)
VPGTAAADDSDVVGGARLAEQGPVVNMTPGLPPLPATTATSFVVADADTGAVLASLNAHQKLAPASTLKTLTAITLLPRLSPTFPTMAQSDAPRADGTKAGIVAGTMYKVDDLFTAMLMMSANDAAVALADANGGLAPTLAEMNAEAAHLQADDTVARTPNGLDAPGQSSSAYDLALIFRAGLADARFRHYLALTRAPFPAPGGKAFQIQTHDKLLRGYPGMIGGKNGYTIAAQASYVGAATRDGHTIIVAVMRDQPNFWDEVKSLLDWGFAADGVASSVGVLVGPAQPKPSQSATPSPHSTTAGDTVHSSGAAGAAGGVSATTEKVRSTGVGLANVMAWTAVGIGALVFLWALARALGRRRRRITRDDHYREGLSRLSALGQVSDRS